MNNPQAADYDVAIVGARVAGSSLALLLGQLGHRVLLIDREHFPSDTLSTHFMNPFAVASLRRLGVLDDVEAAGFRRITRNRTYLDDCHFEGPLTADGSYALAPRRDALDAVLIKHAAERGQVALWERTRATGLLTEDDRVVGVKVSTAGGAERAVRAQVVVGADGKYSQVAEWVGARCYHEVPALRPAYYGYYHGVAPLHETAVELFFGRNQIGFIFPMQPGVDCLALELQPDDFESFRADPQGAFEERFRALPGMAVRLAEARLEGKLQGTRGIPNHFRQPYGPGWALTGDAAYLKDPSTGLGIGDALIQAFWLSEALDAALKGADWEPTMAAFQERRDKALMPAYRATLAFTQQQDASTEDVAWLRAVLSAPHLSRALASNIQPTLLDSYPEPLRPLIRHLAQGFGAAPAAAASSA